MDSERIEELETEKAELKARLARLELLFSSEKKVASGVGYLSLAMLLGPRLSVALKNWYERTDLKSGKFPAAESIDVVAAIFRRITAIGLIGLVLASLPLVLLYQQNKLISVQNDKIDKQNDLLTSQDTMIQKQTRLAETQTTYFETQNLHLVRQNLFTHALQMQSSWIERPELIPYFYHGKEITETTDPAIRDRVLVMCEMLADMLDNAAASELKAMTAEGWGNYAVDMIESSPAFKAFLSKPETQDWYPSIEKWIDFEMLRKDEHDPVIPTTPVSP